MSISSPCIYNQTTSRCISKKGSLGKLIMKTLLPEDIKKLSDLCEMKKRCSKKTSPPTFKIPKQKSPIADKSTKIIHKNLTTKNTNYSIYQKVMYTCNNYPQKSISNYYTTPDEQKIDSDLCINRSKTTLLPHQIKVVKHLQNNRGIIAVHSVGSGKTLMAVTASQCFLDMYPSQNVIVVSPATLIDNFKKDMIKYGIDPENSKYKFYSFEKFAKLISIKDICTNNFLIVDEAHILRTKTLGDKGIKVKQVIACSTKALKVLLLTATPFVNDSYDLENLLSIVKGKLPMNENEWTKITSSTKLFKDYIDGCFSFYNSTKNIEDFPEEIIHEKIIEMDPKFYNEYRKIEAGNENQLEKYKITGNPFRFLQGVRTGLLKLTDSAKLLWTIKHVKKWMEKNEKTVVYTNFVEAGIKNLKLLLENELHLESWDSSKNLNSKKYGIISGKIATKKRKDIIQEFNDDHIDLLMLSSAGGVGIDLKGVRNIVILDVPWNKASLNQAIGRAVRYKSHIHLPINERKVDVWILYNKKPINKDPKDDVASADMILYGILKEKERLDKEFMKIIKKYSI